MNPYILLMILSQFIASFSQILLKKSSEKEYPNRIREYLNVLVIVGYGMMFISLFLTMIAYKGFENFAAVPVLESMGYIIVMLLSRIFFKESITARKGLGIALIIGGIIVYSMV
ncbi:MAG: multidrug ABC transporter [Lachnospiraceae bacterium]|nr:multidrug ABC transporter [Lachnospiraceae bacterium]